MDFEHFDEALGYLLNHTTSVHRRVMSQHTKAFDITPEQYGVLFHLHSGQEAVTQKKLAEMMHKDQATVGKMIDKLEAKAMVQRMDDPTDRRAFLIQLTAEGHQTVEAMKPLSRQISAAAAKGLTDEEIDVFIRVMNTLHDNLSQA